MIFLQPTYLWALFVLVIPFVIHLLNKGDVKTIKVGSVKYLKEFDTKQSRKIRLNELLLLLLRMLLLGLLIVYLAEPQWKIKEENSPLTYMVEPSLMKAGAVTAFLDSLPKEHTKWFTSGFPSIEEEVQPQEPINYWQLAQNLIQVSSDSIVIFTKGRVDGIKGRRPEVARNLNWIIIEEETDFEKIVAARQRRDSVILYEVNGNTHLTDLKKRSLFEGDENIISITSDSITLKVENGTHNIPLLKNDSLKVVIGYDAKYEREMHYFIASFQAIETYGDYDIDLKKIEGDFKNNKEESIDLLAWLKDEAINEFSYPNILIQPDTLANNLIETTDVQHKFYLTKRLTIENTIEEDLTEILAKMLLPKNTLSKLISIEDRRVMADDEITTIFSKEEMTGQNFKTMDVSPWLLLAAGLLLITERFVSKYRKQ